MGFGVAARFFMSRAPWSQSGNIASPSPLRVTRLRRGKSVEKSFQSRERLSKERLHACEPSVRFSIVTFASRTPRSTPSGMSRQTRISSPALDPERPKNAASCADAFTRFVRFPFWANSAVHKSPPPVVNSAAPTRIERRVFLPSKDTSIAPRAATARTAAAHTRIFLPFIAGRLNPARGDARPPKTLKSQKCILRLSSH